MAKRYFLQIAYNGTNYHGWQVQPNAISVQQVLNEGLSKLLKNPINCVGCGRTDSGVHASKFYLHFDTENPVYENFIFRLNRFLPRDIAVQKVIDVHPKAHARFDATYRAYNYLIHFDKNPFLENTSCYFQHGDKLDFNIMRKAFRMLHDFEDFSTFQKKNETHTSICQIFSKQIIYNQNQQKLRIHIAANRFLRGMVRLIVGGLLAVGQQKISLSQWDEALKTQTMLPKNVPAPANGLYLCDVKYPYIV